MEIPWDRLGLTRFSAAYEGESLLFIDGVPQPGRGPSSNIPLVVYSADDVPSAGALERLVLEPERIRFEELSITDWERAPKIIEEFMETIDEVGPNPYKDF